ncbi:phosphatidylinositol kinase- protein kinase tor1 [Coemansia javaensis]|uniref:Serine/threonine-protein kinase TOR n=1 Tax=Coemansia javaensis TaxID=2761396 RepID=A0A9W8LHH1_9FUNG|nr:phosphatidylinositol kinase- protein kinase tor1 [Coemansia javaensis]
MDGSAIPPQLLSRLRSEDESERKGAAQQLCDLVVDQRAAGQDAVYDEISARLTKMVSMGPADQLAAAAVMDALAGTDGLGDNRMMRIMMQTRQLLTARDAGVCQAALRVYRRLIQRRWQPALEAAGKDLSVRMEWLRSGSGGDVQRTTSLQIIEVLCSESLSAAFAQIARVLGALRQPLRDPRAAVREAAGRALGACLGMVPMADRNQRNPQLNFLFEELAANRQLGTAEGTHAALLICRELVVHGGLYMQAHYGRACDMAVELWSHRSAAVRHAAIGLLPHLARYHPHEFARAEAASSGGGGGSMLSRACSHLVALASSDSGADGDCGAALGALGGLALCCGGGFEPFLGATARAIRAALARGSPADHAAGLQAVELLAAAAGPALAAHMDEILDPMFAGGLSWALCGALVALVREVEQLRAPVLGRLLDAASVVLVGAPFRAAQRGVDVLERRMGALSMHYHVTMHCHAAGPGSRAAPAQDDGGDSDGGPAALVVGAARRIRVGPESLALALRALRMFGVGGENLAEFVHSGVVPFLTHSSAEVRREAVRAAAHIALSDAQYRVPGGAGADVGGEIVRRLVSAAVVDVDTSVRLAAVSALQGSAALDLYVGQRQCIDDLALLLGDDDFLVRHAVLSVLGRLASVNPAHAMPPLRRTIAQLLAALEHARCGREHEQCAQLLSNLVRAAGNWVRPHVAGIFAAVAPRIDGAPPALAAHLLEAVAVLARVGGSGLAPRCGRLLGSSIVRALSDGSSLNRRLAALRALSCCASFCAMVIDPYADHPQLFSAFTEILKNTSDPVLRLETMRAIGALGAIDVHRFKDAFAATGSPDGPSSASADAAGGAQGRALRRLRRRRRRQGRTQTSIMRALNAERPLETLAGDVPTNRYGTPFSDAEHCTLVAVNALVAILSSRADADSHQRAAQALVKLLAPLRAAAAPHIGPALAATLAAMGADPGRAAEFYIVLLIRLVDAGGRLIRPHLPMLLRLFGSAAATPNDKLVDLLAALARALPSDVSMHVSAVLSFLTAAIDGDSGPARRCTRSALAALRALSAGQSHDGRLALAMPCLLALLSPADKAAPDMLVDAMDCMAAIVGTVDCSAFASRIVLALVRLLQQRAPPPPPPPLPDEVHTAAMDVLCTLMERLQDQFAVFVPTVEAATRHRPAHPRYERYTRLLAAGRPIPQDQSERHIPPPPPLQLQLHSAAQKSQAADAAAHETVDVAELRRAWGTARPATKEGWAQWLRDLTCELLQQSPSNSLRACAYLAKTHRRLRTSLFNAAFVSCWAVLEPHHRQEAVSALQDAAADRGVPGYILQTILGLANYMERDAQQVPISLKLLGEYADRCHALAKELRYKEAEWMLEKSHDAIAELIELNQDLDLQDSAVGMLELARNENRAIPESVDWYMRLRQWDRALVLHRQREAELGPSHASTMGQIECLFRMSDWAALAPIYDRIWSGDDQALQAESASFGVSMAWAMGDLDRMELYMSKLPANAPDREFSRALLAVCRDNHRDAEAHIRGARKGISIEFASRIAELDSRGYSQMVQCQLLTELEEVISYKKAADDPEHRMTIERTWRERLSGVQQDVGVWQRILRLRSIVLRPILDLDTWIRYVNMCRKSGHLHIARNAIAQLLQDEVLYMNEVNRGEIPIDAPHMERVAAQAREYAHLSALLSMHAPLEGRLAGADGETLDTAIRLSQQPALVYMYLKYKWVANERRSAFQMLQLFTKDYAAQVGFDVRCPDAFHGSADAETERLLARFCFKQAEWLSRIQQSAVLAREARSRAGAEDTVAFSQCGSRIDLIGIQQQQQQQGTSSKYISDDMQMLYELNSERIDLTILESYRAATVLDRKWYKAWHSLAMRHCLEARHYELAHGTAITEQVAELHVVPAVHGFFRAIQLSRSDTTLQDTLRLLTTWFDNAHFDCVVQAVQDRVGTVPVRTWLPVIPQILARIQINPRQSQRLIKLLLAEVGRFHPQAILFSLYVAARGDAPERTEPALAVLAKLHELHPVLVEEAELVSRELNYAAMLLPELWLAAITNAGNCCMQAHLPDAIPEMIRLLVETHRRTRTPVSIYDFHFMQAFGAKLAAAEAALVECVKGGSAAGRYSIELVGRAWNMHLQLGKLMEDAVAAIGEALSFAHVAPLLLRCRDMQLAVPGMYDPDRDPVTISSFDPDMTVYTSQKRPRRMRINGSDGVKYEFLLKGGEDLRQDERVMQVFGLVSSLLARDNETSRRSLAVEQFPVVPLSSNTGLIGYYPNCKVIEDLIKEYRDAHGQIHDLEARMALYFAPNFEKLTPPQKAEVFHYVHAGTPGNDLQRTMWYKAPNAEAWLERRTNYTRSLAVMSIAGYILGLGDRHLRNILLHERTGRVVHIDLGDCFEVASQRDRFPETVPFRLTRMLTMPMDASSIKGLFTHTANHTMRVLRANRDSLMAILVAFVFDPLLPWRYQRDTGAAGNTAGSVADSGGGSYHRRNADPAGARPDDWGAKISRHADDRQSHHPQRLGDSKARAIVKRIHNKLVGTDFNPNVQLAVDEQVDKLIRQATSPDNLAVMYLGWLPMC